jgi:hypothetical protein
MLIKIIIFIIIFFAAFKIVNRIDHSIFITLLTYFILNCFEQYREDFTTDVFKINFSNSAPLILSDGIYGDDNREIPDRLISNMKNMISLTVDDRYIVILTKNNFQSKVLRGTLYIQNENPFENVKKIEVQRQF